MNSKEMIIFIGIQASGKTTFYHEQLAQYTHISLDVLHTRNRERLALEECFASGKSMVIDNTNPTTADRARYISKAKENGYHITQKGINYNDLPNWQKRGIGVYFQDNVKEGYNPVTKETMQTTRRELTVNYELMLGREYGEWVAALADRE